MKIELRARTSTSR